jgi:hypothetical protein
MGWGEVAWWEAMRRHRATVLLTPCPQSLSLPFGLGGGAWTTRRDPRANAPGDLEDVGIFPGLPTAVPFVESFAYAVRGCAVREPAADQRSHRHIRRAATGVWATNSRPPTALSAAFYDAMMDAALCIARHYIRMHETRCRGGCGQSALAGDEEAAAVLKLFTQRCAEIEFAPYRMGA